MIASVGVCTRPSDTAPSNEERRRIVAARVAFMPTIQSASERERAACSSEAIVGAVAQVLETLADRRLGHRVQPQPLDGQLRAGLLVQVGEDQLALAPGVAGVDDEVVVVALQQALDDRHLLLRALVAHDELELARHDRQVRHAPLLELVVVLVGLGELNEVADGPGDRVVGSLEPARGLVAGPGVLLERAREHAREVLSDGRLLGDDERLGHARRTIARGLEGPAGAARAVQRWRCTGRYGLVSGGMWGDLD